MIDLFHYEGRIYMFFKKLLAFFLITSLLSVITIFTVIISHTSKVLNDKVMNSSYSTLTEVNMHINDIINNVAEELLSLSANKTLQQSLLTISTSTKGVSKSIISIRDIILYSKNFNTNYSSVEVYAFNNSYSSVQTKDDVMSVNALTHKAWYKKTLALNGKIYWHVNNDFGYPQLSASRVVINYRNIPNLLAVISLDINLDKFSYILSNIKLLESGKILLTDLTGKVLCPSDSTPKFIKNIKKSTNNYSYNKVTQEFLLERALPTINLNLVGLVPKSELTKDSDDYTYYILTITIIIFILSVFMALIISKRITRPVITLADAMKSVEKGNFNVKVQTSGHDEIASLYSNFNYMVSTINKLINEVYESKLKKKDAELKALQSQINPHFLYNTLNSISWLSIKYNAYEINKAITSLSSIMRYNLNIEIYSTTIREEIDHIKHYSFLQQMRYADKFVIQYEIADNLLECRLLKFLIQPIIENIMKHGLKDNGSITTIIIKIYVDETDIIINIINDGSPIDLDKVNDILTTEDKANPHHGLRNVNERLKLYYDNNPGIKFDLIDNVTHALIKVPIQYGNI